ncbi:MAG: DUF4982 domain-containing protein [Porphyromonadaceae bacterium]|nr:DUF4982 domain-containing protein [Porphyromonadaceae bacterium]
MCLFLFLSLSVQAASADKGVREKYNFNAQWLLHVGDLTGAEEANFPDEDWLSVSLPRAFNEDDAFRVPIQEMTDTVAWYRKHFKLPKSAKGKKVFIEFEGVRQGADFYLNGRPIGRHENGVMAVGFDLTPYIDYTGENVLAVRVDNDWHYKERATGTPFQWNDNNFNANYGGIPKNVWLHITGKVYQTLPLYSQLQTEGVYVYATDINVKGHEATIHAVSQVRNESSRPVTVGYDVEIVDYEGNSVAHFLGNSKTVNPQETTLLEASNLLENVHFWSWGYGYLYKVKTRLLVNRKSVDEVVTTTGFRKTRFAEGKVWLNDRVIQLKGYAQRSSNEWPGVGISVPPWLSDYSNGLLIDQHANLFRWMHITPWKQDIESCDRVGVIEMMPAGDAEKDVEGRQWEQRKELMRDAIIYNRNNPSILFYECGNKAISREHMIEMKAIRDQYDPYGGRVIGAREMLDIQEAEYGGEMLYINKSEGHPMIQTEYCRDEGLRKYWDEYSYPYHRQGDGPLYRGQDASAYNQNQDQLAVEFLRPWYDMWLERPGTGRRVNSGGAKIIFSDTQTHRRSAENYRVSGVVDPMRIPKDGYYAHGVMWDGWVDIENHHTYIIGHWNYSPETRKPVYVVSTGDRVELFVNGRSQGFGAQDYRFLFTFDSVQWEKGVIEAVSYDARGNVLSRDSKKSVGEPQRLKLTLMQGPQGTFADGSDLALVQVEVVDEEGNRCPLANNKVKFNLQGPAEWRGGVAQGEDNYALSQELPVECGITRVMIRTTTEPGEVTLFAEAEGLPSEKIAFVTQPVEIKDGLSTFFPAAGLPSRLDRGETPETPSYRESKVDVRVDSIFAGSNQSDALKSIDDNEASEWRNDGRLSTAWITYRLERSAEIDDICLKLSGWRQRSYPLEVYAGDTLIWSGETEKSLGYIHLLIDKPVRSNLITVRLRGATHDADAFGQITEVSENKSNELDVLNNKSKKNELRIVEIEFRETL